MGSRSTYYGRLHPDRPSYTVGTYYNRQGNGCSLHYDADGCQHRTLSHREAARLQGFPDSFTFTGPQRAVCQQVGNAVPPLLALQVAAALGEPGTMVDVFAGAGGLSLGFDWAGWRTLTAVDSDRHAVATFNANVAPVAFVGDMNRDDVHDRVLAATLPGQRARHAMAGRGTGRVALVGGPPCQGLSTGGNRRSPLDARNLLHARYAALLGRLRPDVFVFENVLGLLSMEGGAFVADVLDGLRRTGYDVVTWRLNAACLGLPQRRERVVIVGVPHGAAMPRRPVEWTSPVAGGGLFLPPTPGVRDALDDLPPLVAGQDGSGLPYRHGPMTDFQRFARGAIRPADYLVEASATHDSARRSGPLRSLPAAAE